MMHVRSQNLLHLITESFVPFDQHLPISPTHHCLPYSTLLLWVGLFYFKSTILVRSYSKRFPFLSLLSLLYARLLGHSVLVMYNRFSSYGYKFWVRYVVCVCTITLDLFSALRLYISTNSYEQCFREHGVQIFIKYNFISSKYTPRK